MDVILIDGLTKGFPSGWPGLPPVTALNGLSLSKLRPYGSGFMIFSDYGRAPIRLAAIMEIPVIYIFTHDSIGVGEDGPTHQPVEQLSSLRAIPGLITLRPGDANETLEAWRLVLQLHHEPAFGRQVLPVVLGIVGGIVVLRLELRRDGPRRRVVRHPRMALLPGEADHGPSRAGGRIPGDARRDRGRNHALLDLGDPVPKQPAPACREHQGSGKRDDPEWTPWPGADGKPHVDRCRGSRASRTPSPRKL